VTVVKFDGGVELVREGHVPLCRHRQVTLDAPERTAYCARCGKTLDPFEVLLMYADAGAKEARRADDAEVAAEKVAELTAAGGRVNITRRRIEAKVKIGGKWITRSGAGVSLFQAINVAAGDLLQQIRWAERARRVAEEVSR
jgi:hypothetical protein